MTATATFLEPTWMTVPEWDYTLGPEVGELCAAAGFAPDPPQQLILDATFAIKDGRPAAFEVVIVAPRQNIKTGVEKQISLGWMFLLKRRVVVWSAHEVSTSSASFKDIVELIEANDFLSRRVAKFYRPEGRERVEFTNGAHLRFKARTKSGGRGLTGDDTILDEAFALKSSHLGALLPVMLTKPHAQVIYGSSAGLVDSANLRGLRDRGRRGDRRLAYFEWGDTKPREGCLRADCDHAITREGCALDDRSRWYATNPTLGHRIDEESLANLRRSLPPEEFARECLGWWDDGGSADAPFDYAKWTALADHLGAGHDLTDVRLAVDMPQDRRSTAIIACGRRPDGVPQIEVVKVAPGVDWVLPAMAELKRRRKVREVVIDGASAAASLVPALTLDGHKVTTTNGREMAAACGSMFDAVEQSALRHVPHADLAAAVEGARRRPLGDAWGLDKKNAQVDIAPLVGAVLAHWAVTRTRPRKTDEELIRGLG